MTNNTTIKVCDYCNTSDHDDWVKYNGKSYCCYGCATLDNVVEQIRNTPLDISIKYKQFDLPENFDKLVDYQNESIYKVAVSLPSIHCSSCIELLEDLPSFKEGILRAEVNFEQRKCMVTAEKSVALSFLCQLLHDIGYPPQLTIDFQEKELERKHAKQVLLKMAVAGFCFGNIMLFSLPQYFGLTIASDLFFTRLFSALTVVFSLPVLFYSGRDYLTSAYKALIAGKSHLNIPISLGVLVLFGWSLYEIISGIGIGYLDSLAGLIFFLLVGKWFQTKVYDQVSYKRQLQDFIPMVVRKWENQKEAWQKIDELSKGDTVWVKNEEVIPVNGTLVKGKGLVDYSFITGESIPEEVKHGEVLYAGGSQKAGSILIELTEKPSKAKLWATWGNDTSTKEFTNNWTAKISKYFTIAVIAIAIAAGAIWMFIDPSKALFVFCSVLIVACPCALALSSPFTYGSIMRVFSKNMFYVKNALSLSSLSKIKHVVFDKTGTLSKKEAVAVSFQGEELNASIKGAIASLASQSTHPYSQIIANHFQEIERIDLENIQEIAGKGIQAVFQGEVIKLGSEKWISHNLDSSNGANVYVSLGSKVIGHFNIKAAYRNGISTLLNTMGLNYHISVLSGDNDSEKATLKSFFNDFKSMKFNLKPNQKLLAINGLKSHESVAMLGDGINDSSAIENADFGIAVTDNLNNFYPGSDAVLLSENFGKLPSFFELARYSNKILKWSLWFSLLYNIAGVSFAVVGLLTPIVAAILMPLSSISIVLLDTLLVRSKSKNLQLL